MENKLMLSYLWQEMIRVAFTPSHPSEWMRRYNDKFSTFLEYSQPQKHPTSRYPLKGELSVDEMNLYLEFELKQNGHFSITYNHLNNDSDPNNIWTHDCDPSFFDIPLDYLLENQACGNARRSACVTFERKDLEDVLDAAIFHPREHQHIISPINNHKIRIGGGLNNPFLYLFHLRYQFCPEQKRPSERKRLLDLFENIIRKNNQNGIDDGINSMELMG